MIDIIPFKNLQVASNDSIDYYQLNRVFDRTYDFSQTVSGNVSVAFSPLSSIPYATTTTPGFVKYSQDITDANDLVISSQQISAYIQSDFNTVITSSNIGTDLYVTSGYNKLINGLKIQFGHQLINTASSSSTFQSLSGTVVFNTDVPTQYEISTLPVILFQIIDNVDHLKYKYRYKLYNATSNGFEYTVDVTNNTIDVINKSNFYISWLAIGV